MRKLLIAGALGVLSLALAAVAIAQTPAEPPSATLTVTVSPTKAGTKTRPAAGRIELTADNNRESRTTASKLEIFIPKSIKLSTAGLKTCSTAKLNNEGKAACPRAARAGSGTSEALLNPFATNPAPIHFNVTTFVGGKNLLNFFLESQSPRVSQALPGKISSVSMKLYGQKIAINIPKNLQQPAPGAYSALLQLKSSIGLKSGRRTLVGVTDCPRAREHPFRLKITYVPNPNPPATSSVNAIDGARCSG